MTDLENRIAGQQGIENHPHGYMLLRVMRLVKTLVARVKALEDRVSALEGKR